MTSGPDPTTLVESTSEHKSGTSKRNTLATVDHGSPMTNPEGSSAKAHVTCSDEDGAPPPGNAWLLRLTWREPSGDDMDEVGW
jgi:hypothetical protein